MRRRSLQIGWSALLVLPLLSTAAAEDLVWRSGESLSGTLLDASAERVTFQPELDDLFAGPVDLAIERLQKLSFQGSEQERMEAFQVRLTDGTLLLADLLGRSGSTVRLRSDWLGEFELKQEWVQEIRRVRGPGVVLSAPGPTVVWQEKPTAEERDQPADPFAPMGGELPWNPPSKVQPKLSAPGQLSFWALTPSGGLRTLSWNQQLQTTQAFSKERPLPDRCRIQIALSAEGGQAEFSLKLTTDQDPEVRVETWGEELVLRRGSRFDRVSMADALTDGRVVLTLLWDRTTGALELLLPSGESVVRLPPTGGKAEAKPTTMLALSLQNLWTNLTMESLGIYEWSGEPLPSQTAQGPFLTKVDGRRVSGRWVKGDAQSITLQGKGGQAETVPLQQVAMLFCDHQAPPVPPSESADTVSIVSQAGELLEGRFEGVSPAQEAEGGRARLQHQGGEGPWAAALAHITEIRWNGEVEAAAVMEGADHLTLPDGGRLTGRLEAHGDPLPRWRFDGAEEATALSTRSPVTAALERGHAEAPEDVPQALLHLVPGDVVAADLRAVTDAGIQFAAPGLMRTTLATADLKAVLFPGQPLITEGFADGRWQWGATGGEYEEGNLPLILPGQRLMHPSMMDCREISLQFKPSDVGYSALRMTLHTRGLTEGEDPMRVLVGLVGSDIYCGEASGDGQFRQQMELPWEEGDIHVELRVEEEELVVRVNRKGLLRLAFPAERRLGSGLILDTSTIWNNEPQEVMLTGFHAKDEPGRLAAPSVDPEAREHALTVPRLRQDDPPQHALLAPNGDVLRGTVEDFDGRMLTLRSGLETLRVPVDRVAALVFLQREGPDPSGEEPPAALRAAATVSHWVELTSGARVGLSLQRWAEDGVVGLNPLLGRVRLPLNQVMRLHLNQAPPVEAALDAVSGWVLKLAPEPEIPEGEGGSDGSDKSPLLGQTMKDFTLPQLDGSEWTLSGQEGKVVVLDFWASWCGPCLKAMPELMTEMEAFTADQVSFIGVNQAESAEHVQTFLQTRGWDLMVGLDEDQAVSRQFAVNGIPHTVIIGPDGKVAWVKSGYSLTGAASAAKMVKSLLENPPSSAPANDREIPEALR